MSTCIRNQNIRKDILSGLTGAMLLGSYALCTCAAVGLDLWNVFFCVIVCSLFSAKSKNKLYSPDAFLLLPVHYVITECGSHFLPICLVAGSIFYYLLAKFVNKTHFSKGIIAWATLLFALVATVILTNRYFGIGATGSTAVEMLKSYRSLGFHPHFRGLLYGTITLFAMITYPFKYRKLNKVLPAEFITLLIPLVLNLFLNPQMDLTTINEIESFRYAKHYYNIPFGFSENFDSTAVPSLVLSSLYFGFMLFLRSSDENKFKNTLSNLVSSISSLVPTRQFNITHYSPVSSVVTILVCVLVIIFCPNLLARIPMHCVGALLIVSAWQQVPYKNLSLLFKKTDKGAGK